MAPEVIRQDSVINEKCDVWSFGVVRAHLKPLFFRKKRRTFLRLTQFLSCGDEDLLGAFDVVESVWRHGGCGWIFFFPPFKMKLTVELQPFALMMLVGTQSKTLPVPDSCPDQIASLLEACWAVFVLVGVC